jgi:hypothetical protein
MDTEYKEFMGQGNTKDEPNETETSKDTSKGAMDALAEKFGILMKNDKDAIEKKGHSFLDHKKKWVLLNYAIRDYSTNCQTFPLDVAKIIGSLFHTLTMDFWNRNHCSKDIRLDEGMLATKINTCSWANVVGNFPGSYKIKIENIASNFMMIGLAPNTTAVDAENSETCGFYIYSSDSSLWSQRKGADLRRVYAANAKKMETGTVVEVVLENNTIKYIIDGCDCGVAFTDLDPSVTLYPSIDFYNENCAVRAVQ